MLTHSQTYPHIREHHSNFHAPSVMFKRGFSSFIGPVVMVVGSGDGTQSLPCARWAAYQWGTPLALLKMPSITLTDRHHYPCFTVHMEQNNQAALSATLWELTEKATAWRTAQMHQVCLRNLLALLLPLSGQWRGISLHRLDSHTAPLLHLSPCPSASCFRKQH